MSANHKLVYLAVASALLVAVAPTAGAQARYGVTVPATDADSREQATALWKRFALTFGRTDRIVDPNWTGTSAPACVAGTTSVAWQEQNARQVNVVRSLIGLNIVTNQGGQELKEAQDAALLQYANFPVLTHNPEPSSKCFTASALRGSQMSNLGGFTSAWSAVDGYMNDGGDINYFVGHRQTLIMARLAAVASGGAGTTTSGNFVLMTPLRPIYEQSSDTSFVAWPSPGYFPVELLPVNSLRWSLGCAGCSASSAQVTMTVDGNTLPVVKEPTAPYSGYAETIVWQVPQAYINRFVTLRCANGQGCYNTAKTFADSTATVRVTGMIGPDQQLLPPVEYKVTLFNGNLTRSGNATAPIMPGLRYDGLWSSNGGESGFAIAAGATGVLTAVVFGNSAANGEWYALRDGRWTDTATFQGKLYLPAADGTHRLVGGARIAFDSATDATATYTINGANFVDRISRVAVGPEAYDWEVHNATGNWLPSESSNSRLFVSQDFRSATGVYATFAGTRPVWYRLAAANFGAGDARHTVAASLLDSKGSSVGAATITVGAKGQTLSVSFPASSGLAGGQFTRAHDSGLWAGNAAISLSKRGGVDFDGAGKSQLIVRDDAAGEMQVGRLVNNQFQWSTAPDPGKGFRVLGAVDLAGTGKSDLLFQSTTQGEFGDVSAWLGFSPASTKFIRSVKTAWQVQTLADMDGDGKGDVVFRWTGNDADTGVSYIWFTDVNSASPVAQIRKRGGAPLSWSLVGAADLNDDGAADMVYVSPDSQIRVLMATGSAAAPRTCANYAAGAIPAGFTILKFADFTGARRGGDILIRNASTGEVRLISLVANGIQLPTYTGDPNDRNAACTDAGSSASIATLTTSLGIADPSFSYAASGDFNGDGVFDIAWRQGTGSLALWLIPMAGAPTLVSDAGSIPSGFAPIALQ
jgi:hypothetical protein